ncbi:cytochrome P450 714C2-like [Aristolochia californica]|uniref:cytochrome P450 714C2-like n=1 Tax=Aristolochia californica TaxID=171875 RepID=UPI0035E01239
MELSLKMWLSFLVMGFCSLCLFLYNDFWLKPQRIRRKQEKQGIYGPRPSFFLGNIPDIKKIQAKTVRARPEPGGQLSHDYYRTMFPHLEEWKRIYGPVFTFSIGVVPILHIADTELAKDLIQMKTIDLGKTPYLRKNRGAMLGNGVMASSGDIWLHQRKIIAPEFFMDKIKGMTDMMLESLKTLTDGWEKRVDSASGVVDMNVDSDLRTYTADVISKACFGSSFNEGKEIFSQLKTLQIALSKQTGDIGIPGLRYIPNKSNREAWRLDREIRLSIMKVIKEREKRKVAVARDLLQIILNSVRDGHISKRIARSFIIDNCKTVYFAGHETSATTVAWVLLLLAKHPEWQDRVRAEIREVCKGLAPDADMISKLKVLTMILQETMRLYPVALLTQREARRDMKVGNLEIPKGLNIWIPTMDLHQNPKLWGPDALEFNPERFANGVSGACKLPLAYIPFGVGPRICLGQHFAMVQLKIVLSVVLSKFAFYPSPTYRHAVAYRLVLGPEDTVNLIVKRI